MDTHNDPKPEGKCPFSGSSRTQGRRNRDWWPDALDLSVTRGPGADEVTLSWAGGVPPYRVYRSTTAPTVPPVSVR